MRQPILPLTILTTIPDFAAVAASFGGWITTCFTRAAGHFPLSGVMNNDFHMNNIDVNIMHVMLVGKEWLKSSRGANKKVK